MNPPTPEPAELAAPPVANLELKAALLLVLMGVLLVGSVLFVLYARGTFEATQRLVLVTDDSEGVQVGMDLTFAGFPIGRVRDIQIAPEGRARIVIDLPRKDVHWLRSSSVFVLTRNLVGGISLRAVTGIPGDPPLPEDAERSVLVGDATAEIPRLVADARELVRNLNALTAPDSAMATSLANVQSATDKLKGPQGALGLLFGNEADAKKIVTTLDRTNALLARLDGVAGKTESLLGKVDGMAAKADAQVFGNDGVMREARATAVQLNGLLADARGTLQKVDALLAEAQGVAANARSATTDLGPLRTEVEASVRKLGHLVDEINRKWPFARDTEIKLP
jgi:phospholipid/cholesterol/gamma-HCH transport system substrate-binding protein